GLPLHRGVVEVLGPGRLEVDVTLLVLRSGGHRGVHLGRNVRGDALQLVVVDRDRGLRLLRRSSLDREAGGGPGDRQDEGQERDRGGAPPPRNTGRAHRRTSVVDRPVRTTFAPTLGSPTSSMENTPLNPNAARSCRTLAP